MVADVSDETAIAGVIFVERTGRTGGAAQEGSQHRVTDPPHRPEPSPQLIALATIVADWAEPAPGLRRVFLFGSRVRGDHRADSDVDLCIDQKNDIDADQAIDWWLAVNASDFADLRSIVPGPLSLHVDYDRTVWPLIWMAAREPFFVKGKCHCLWLPPKPPGAPPARPFGPPRPQLSA